MTSAYSSLSVAIVATVAMLVLAVQLDLLSLPELRTRCGACGRLRFRAEPCACSTR